MLSFQPHFLLPKIQAMYLKSISIALLAHLATAEICINFYGNAEFCPSTFEQTVLVAPTCHKFQQICSDDAQGPAGSQFKSKNHQSQIIEGNSYASVNLNPQWSHRPECLASNQSADEFCLYTSSTFANDRGISVWVTPETASRLLHMPAFADPEALADVNVPQNLPFVQTQIPGRGSGLISNRTLHRGDRILSNTPLYIVDETVYADFDLQKRAPLQRKGVHRLPRNSTQAFLDLWGHWGGDHVDDVINTNSFAVDMWEGTKDEIAVDIVLPEISRLNHDCRPNAHYYFDTETLTHHIHALRTIGPGEELTITYIDPVQLRQRRQEELQWNWGFKCSCSSCTQPKALSTTSDTRIKQITALIKHLSNRNASSRATPQMAELLISLYEQERILAPIAEAYTFAAREYNGVGDGYLAMKYASLAVEAGILYGGEKTNDVVDMKNLLEEPSKHWSWKFRRSLSRRVDNAR